MHFNAGDALTATAFLLESLSDVDAMFVKVADKECEMASTSLKKWFKKLAVRPTGRLLLLPNAL